jgi:hypothetical protein
MKRTISILALAAFTTGCAHFKSTVTETRDTNGVITKITVVKAGTFWDAGSELTKFSSGQTDKSQKVAIGSLNQDSSGTNAVVLIQVLGNAAMGAVKP